MKILAVYGNPKEGGFVHAFMRKLMFSKNPDTYANVIKCWQHRRWM